MQLPTNLQHFHAGALIVAADTILARCFLIGGDALEELDGVALPKETSQDGEGSFEFFPDDAPRLRAFAKKLAERLSTIERQQGIPIIHLVMPAVIEHLVSKYLPHDVANKVGTKIHHDVMKESSLSIVKRVVQALSSPPETTRQRPV